MVEKKTYGDKTVFVCDECGMKYSEKGWAEKCEDYCRKNNSCSLEITEHAIRSE